MVSVIINVHAIYTLRVKNCISYRKISYSEAFTVDCAMYGIKRVFLSKIFLLFFSTQQIATLLALSERAL